MVLWRLCAPTLVTEVPSPSFFGTERSCAHSLGHGGAAPNPWDFEVQRSYPQSQDCFDLLGVP